MFVRQAGTLRGYSPRPTWHGRRLFKASSRRSRVMIHVRINPLGGCNSLKRSLEWSFELCNEFSRNPTPCSANIISLKDRENPPMESLEHYTKLLPSQSSCSSVCRVSLLRRPLVRLDLRDALLPVELMGCSSPFSSLRKDNAFMSQSYMYPTATRRKGKGTITRAVR